MRLTHLADYAVVMMTAAARRGDDVRVSAAELAGDTGVPLPTAQKLMGQLASAGLLSSVRGAGGGFALARPVTEISLADIVEAVEGPIRLTTCVDAERHDCALHGCCQVRPHMGVVNDAVRGALASVSLASLITPTGLPELVEGRSCSSTAAKEAEGFDRLSQAGFREVRL